MATYTVSSGESIQAAIDGASSGDTIDVAAGTFNEEVLVNKDNLTLQGAGVATNGTGTVIEMTDGGNGIEIAASGVTVKDLLVRYYQNGLTIDGAYSDIAFTNVHSVECDVRALELHNDADITNLTLENVNFSNGQNEADGIRMATEASVDGLTIRNSNIDNNPGIGIEVYQSESNPGVLTNVTIEDTTINNSQKKGIYAEKLSNATLNNVTVDGVLSDTYVVNGGIDLNTKYGDYSNITIQNSVIANVSEGDPLNDNPSFSTAVAIKARDDGSYGDTPATLDSVTLDNVTVRDSFNGLRFGEIGVDYSTHQGPTNVTVTGCTFENNQREQVLDLSDSIDLASVLNNNTFDKYAYQSIGIYFSIQAAIDGAVNGDVIQIEEGTYVEAINIDKELTVEAVGSRDNTILDVSDSDQVSGKGRSSGVAYNAVSIISDNVTVRGLFVRGGGKSGYNSNIEKAFKPDQVNNIKIENCRVDDLWQASWGAGVGFDLYAVKNGSLESCVAKNNGGSAVFISNGEDIDITLNSTENNWGSVGIGPAVSGQTFRENDSNHEVLNGPTNIRFDDNNQFNDPLDNGTPAIWFEEYYSWSTTKDGSDVIFLDNRITAHLDGNKESGWETQTYFYAVPDSADKSAVQAAIDGVNGMFDGTMTGPVHLTDHPTVRNFRTKTVYVDDPANDWRLDYAVDFAESGDDVRLDAYEYDLNNCISKSVALIGNNENIDPVSRENARNAETVLLTPHDQNLMYDDIKFIGLTIDNSPASSWRDIFRCQTAGMSGLTFRNVRVINSMDIFMWLRPYVDNLQNFLWENVLFKESAQPLSAIWSGNYVNMVVRHCKWEANTHDCIHTDNMENFTIEDSIFGEGCNVTCVTVGMNANGVTIDGCYFANAHQRPIETYWKSGVPVPQNVYIRNNVVNMNPQMLEDWFEHVRAMSLKDIRGDLHVENNTVRIGNTDAHIPTVSAITLEGGPYDDLRIVGNSFVADGINDVTTHGTAGVWIKDENEYGEWDINNSLTVEENLIKGFEYAFKVFNRNTVEVSGAGTDVVNGTYHISGTFELIKEDDSSMVAQYDDDRHVWDFIDPSTGDVLYRYDITAQYMIVMNGAEPAPSFERVNKAHATDAFRMIPDANSNRISCDRVVNPGVAIEGKDEPQLDDTNKFVKK